MLKELIVGDRVRLKPSIMMDKYIRHGGEASITGVYRDIKGEYYRVELNRSGHSHYVRPESLIVHRPKTERKRT
jgi:hypothetical protein